MASPEDQETAAPTECGLTVEDNKNHANGSSAKSRVVAEKDASSGGTTLNLSRDDEEQNDPKRVKTDTLLKDVMSEEIIGLDMAAIQSKYRHDKPYSYGLLPNLFRPDFLKSCIREIKDNSTVNFKESDLFRVYQSIDLANLDQKNLQLGDKMPHTMQLRSVLYSPEWRRWMEEFHQLPPGTLSSDQVDCACNCHATGCHLLCHDDVIGTRKISYILYLTEDDWQSCEGGALELYDSIPVVVENDDNNMSSNTPTQRRIPEALPSATVLPQFNHMAMFVVQPGISFHAVQEVLGDRPRLSLQGWYHAALPPDNLHHATLQRLKSYQGPDAQREEDTEGDYTPIEYNSDDPNTATNADAPPEMLASDRAFLAQYLHPTYLEPSAIRDICAKFEEDSSVQLRHFLNDTWVEKLKGFVASAECLPGRDMVDPTNPTYYQWGVSKEWQTVGPSHKQRFLEYVPPCGDQEEVVSVSDTVAAAASESDCAIRMGRALYELKTQLLQSTAFARYLGHLTSLGLPTAHRGRVRRFRSGRDYTVAHYGLLTETSVLDATLCFAAGSGGDAMCVDENDMRASSTDSAKDDSGISRTPTPPTDEADEIWQSGDCGGFECYIAAEDDDNEGSGQNEAADEYNPDDDTELLSVSVSNNTLSLVYRDPGTMRFIKYVGSRAPSSRWDVAMEYEVPGENEDDENEDDENEDDDGRDEERGEDKSISDGGK